MYNLRISLLVYIQIQYLRGNFSIRYGRFSLFTSSPLMLMVKILAANEMKKLRYTVLILPWTAKYETRLFRVFV